MSDFSSIYREYYPKIVRYLKRLVGDLEAEDIAQEVFVKVNRSLDSFRGESSLSTWIYRIATNTAMDHLRKPSSRLVRPAEDNDLVEEDAGPVDIALLHDTPLIRKDMNACIRGIEGYGSDGVFHTSKILELSTTLPVKIEVVDSEEMINDVLPDVASIVEKGLIEVSDTNIVKCCVREKAKK